MTSNAQRGPPAGSHLSPPLFPFLMRKRKNEPLSSAVLPLQNTFPSSAFKRGKIPREKSPLHLQAKTDQSRPRTIFLKKSKKNLFPQNFFLFFCHINCERAEPESLESKGQRETCTRPHSPAWCRFLASGTRVLIFLLSFLHNFSLRTGGESLPARRRASPLRLSLLSKKTKKEPKGSSLLFALLLPFLKTKNKTKMAEKAAH